MIMDFQKEKQLLEKKQEQWEKQKEIILMKQSLQEDRQNIKKNSHKKLSTSKLIVLFLFLNCTIIEIFTGYVTLKSLNLGIVDFSPLTTLISAVVGEVICFAVYAYKATKENTEGGITYENAKFEQSQYVSNLESEVYKNDGVDY